MKSEAVVSKEVMIEASRLGFRVFRNNVGTFKTMDNRIVKTGLCTGSSDLIGWTPCGKFAALEVKRKGGKATPAQLNFIAQVKKAGGFGCIIDDPNNLKKMLDEFYES